MKVVGCYLVRNEADIIAANLRFHFATAIDFAFVVDNGSTDGTDKILAKLSKSLAISWSRDDGPYRQSKILTSLAREAAAAGADWVIPIDADEFWSAQSGHLRSVLSSTGAGVLKVPILTFIQHRQELKNGPCSLRTMIMRPSQQIGPPEKCHELVENRSIPFVEMMYEPKCISRPSSTIIVRSGNHFVDGVPGDVEHTDKLACFHAPLRSRQALLAKVEHGRRVAEGGFAPGESWHVRRWARLADEGAMGAEWEANSYESSAGGAPRNTWVVDRRLADAVEPWLPPRRVSGWRKRARRTPTPALSK